jgi:FixJ family two-component response regulator
MIVNANIALIEDNVDCALALQSLFSSVKIKSTIFSSAEEFLEKNDELSINCIVADIRLPGMSGLQLQRELIEKKSKIPFIVISGHANISLSVQAMKDGAKDFFTKPIKNQDLLDCIFTAVQGDEKDKMAKQKTLFDSRLALLTAREKEVLLLIAQGLPSKTIAAELSVSKNTVDVHRVNILRKMQTKTVGQLIAQAVYYGLVDIELS